MSARLCPLRCLNLTLSKIHISAQKTNVLLSERLLHFSFKLCMMVSRYVFLCVYPYIYTVYIATYI